MKKQSIKKVEHINSLLNQIVAIQSHLSDAEFNIDQFMNLVVKEVKKLTSADSAVIELVEEKDMVYRAATGKLLKKHLGLRLPKNNSISGLCVKSGKVLISNDTELDKRVNLEACRRVKCRSLVVSPLFYKGEAVGVIKIMSSKPKMFNQKDVTTLQLMAGLIASALAHQIFYDTKIKLLEERTKTLDKLKKAEEKLQEMAHYDYLTHLPNRRLFSDRLTLAINRAKRYNKSMAICFLDIDKFKLINDNFGHDFGDELLRSFASRLVQCVRESDTVARLGGDEFVIILEDLIDVNDVIIIAEKILKTMQNDFNLKNKTLKATTSIGICFLSNSFLSPDEHLKHADQALYEAKQAGRNNFKIYSDLM